MEKLFVCPCCGYRTLNDDPPGSHEICEVCFWEDDGVQYYDPDYRGGANSVSLRTGQKNFKEFGSCKKRTITYVTKDRSKFEYVGKKDLRNYRRVDIEEMYEVFRVLEIPTDKLLELYTTKSLREGQLTFSSDELDKYLTHEEVVDYYALTESSGLFLELSSIKNMCALEKSKRLESIKEKLELNLKSLSKVSKKSLLNS